MSFILDALRKSENERQRTTGPAFAAVPVARSKTRASLWIKALAALLVVNLIVVPSILLWPGNSDPTPNPIPATPTTPATPEPTTRAPVARRVQQGDRTVQPLAAQVSSGSTEPEPAVSKQRPEQSTPPPTFRELRASGALGLPDLHLDIHVYAEQSADRFVFINMHKYHEGERLDEGPVVEAITTEGVVLRQRDERFLLPRE